MKKFRRSRDERKKMTKIGKNENQDMLTHISPVKLTDQAPKVHESSTKKKTPFNENK